MPNVYASHALPGNRSLWYPNAIVDVNRELLFQKMLISGSLDGTCRCLTAGIYVYSESLEREAPCQRHEVNGRFLSSSRSFYRPARSSSFRDPRSKFYERNEIRMRIFSVMVSVPIILMFISVVDFSNGAHTGAARPEDILRLGKIGHLLASQIVAFSSLMLDANITVMCSSLVVFGSPRYCDCLQCLNAETNFRGKYCRFGELVRSNEQVREIHSRVMEISGVDHLSKFLADDFYTAYCDFKRCPWVPQQCCSYAKSYLRIKPNDCPSCLPVDHRYRPTCVTP